MTQPLCSETSLRDEFSETIDELRLQDEITKTQNGPGQQLTGDPPNKPSGGGTVSLQQGPSFAAATAPSYAHALFFSREPGSNGNESLRPGWGFAFYALGYYLLQREAGNLIGAWNIGTLRGPAILELALLAAAVIPALVLARVERRAWSAYGLPLRIAFGKIFWQGALWGFAGITLLLVALHELHTFNFGHIVLHGARLFKFAAFWAAMFLAVGLYEEFLLRGYAQFTLARGLGFWPAAVTLSCIFGALHLNNAGENVRGALAAASIGLFLCLTLRRTGRLWFAVGFHAAWDWGESFFYSVPDSGTVSPGHLLSSSFHGSPWLTGGSVGPEGSVMCFVVIAAASVAFSRAYPARPRQAVHAADSSPSSSQ